jgi:hypothetical protein
LSKSLVAALFGVPMLLIGLAVCSYPVLDRLQARCSATVLLPDRLVSITAFWPWADVETLRVQRVTDAAISVSNGEAELAQIRAIDDGIDRAYEIVFCDVVIEQRREQSALTAIHPFHEPGHHPPA